MDPSDFTKKQSNVLVSIWSPSTSVMVPCSVSCCELLFELRDSILWLSPTPTPTHCVSFSPCQHIAFFLFLLRPLVLLKLSSISANDCCPEQGQSASLSQSTLVQFGTCFFGLETVAWEKKTCPGKINTHAHTHTHKLFFTTLSHTQPSSNSSALC